MSECPCLRLQQEIDRQAKGKYLGKTMEVLIEGKDAKEVADILRGNDCNMKGTSCADQLAKAIDEYNK